MVFTSFRVIQKYTFNILNLGIKNQEDSTILKICVLILVLLFSNACNDDDDNVPTNPVDQLPPATQSRLILLAAF